MASDSHGIIIAVAGVVSCYLARSISLPSCLCLFICLSLSFASLFQCCLSVSLFLAVSFGEIWNRGPEHPLQNQHVRARVSVSISDSVTLVCFSFPSLAGAAKSIIFVATNTRLSQQNAPFVATKRLSQQTRVTKVLSRQAYFCREKRRVLSRQKWYSWQLPPVILSVCVGDSGFCCCVCVTSFERWLTSCCMVFCRSTPVAVFFVRLSVSFLCRLSPSVFFYFCLCRSSVSFSLRLFLSFSIVLRWHCATEEC